MILKGLFRPHSGVLKGECYERITTQPRETGTFFARSAQDCCHASKLAARSSTLTDREIANKALRKGSPTAWRFSSRIAAFPGGHPVGLPTLARLEFIRVYA